MEDGFSSLSAAAFQIGDWPNCSGSGVLSSRPHPAGGLETLLPPDHCYHHRDTDGERKLTEDSTETGGCTNQETCNEPVPLPPPPPPMSNLSYNKDNGSESPLTTSPWGDYGKEDFITPPMTTSSPADHDKTFFDMQSSPKRGNHVTTIYVPPPDDQRFPVLEPLSGPHPAQLRYGPSTFAGLTALTPLTSLAPISGLPSLQNSRQHEDNERNQRSSDSPSVYGRAYRSNQDEPRKSVSGDSNWTLAERLSPPDGMSAPDMPPTSSEASSQGLVNDAFEPDEVHLQIEREVIIRPGDSTVMSKVVSHPPEGTTKSGSQENGQKEAVPTEPLDDGDAQEVMDEEAKWLQWMEIQFSTIAGDDGEIDLAEFKTALGVKKSFFAERFFALFDADGSGTIELAELMDGLKMLSKGTPKQKLKFLFDVYDVDGGGTIDFDELKTVLASCMDESSLQLTEQNLEDLTRVLFESADEDGSGAISFDELVGELEKFPGVMENLTISAANWLKPPEEKKKKGFTIPRYLTKQYILNNMRKVVFLIIYLLLNIGLFALNAVRYRNSNGWVIVARGSGMCLNFNSTFIVVLMLRYCLTWLRSTRVGPFLPLDQSVLFHKMVGLSIAFFTFLHTVAHYINIALVREQAAQPNTTVPVHLRTLEYWEFAFTLRAQIGWLVPGFAYLSGFFLDLILIIMVICSMPFIRRGGYFQVFYWTHMLYIPFWVFLILHGPIFWYFFVVPGFLFILERINVSKFYKLARFGHVKIKQVNLLPGRVTHLIIGRPSKFRYKPGDYIFVNIPNIALYEWHPFTVSSAPEHEGEVWLHVRSVGHWTNKLFDYFDQLEDTAPVTNGKVANHVDVNEKKTPTRRPKHRTKYVNVEIFIDGPYGTSTREIFDSEHAVLIASGIGVTPYAAILQSVHRRYIAYKKTCPCCSHEWYGDVPEHVMKLKKVDFIWLNRNQKCFEWFVPLFSEMEVDHNDPENQLTQDERHEREFISMHFYVTSALGKTDMKGVGLQMAMDMLYKKEGRDLLTGLRSRTQAGRPNWSELFGKIHKRKAGRVNVFFCGSPQLSKALKIHAESYGFHFSKENF